MGLFLPVPTTRFSLNIGTVIPRVAILEFIDCGGGGNGWWLNTPEQHSDKKF
ncbi:hypothetical protein FIBSPDRAFT_351213 [Athelia psychrophila]|uniref:Uncharacterized protein n=1 Tax=Athelia psychrophila TaxID=1759441 RepID=A0A166PP15_9AGAM|nr:hypothetical protein FIBSPDRAFT_351213 [Fibularhizoctonia sp. CBS 109695]